MIRERIFKWLTKGNILIETPRKRYFLVDLDGEEKEVGRVRYILNFVMYKSPILVGLLLLAIFAGIVFGLFK